MPASRYLRAEYDFDNNRVVALENVLGQVHNTHNPRVLGARTEWVEVETRLPAKYNPRFDYLLHADDVRFGFDPDTQVVTIEYPRADFTPNSLRILLKDQAKEAARRELSDTDWYVVRMMETGTPIPPEVLARREEIRSLSNEYVEQLDVASPVELDNFEVNYGTKPEKNIPKPNERDPVVRGGDGSEWITDASEPGQKGNPVEPAPIRGEDR